MTVTMGKSLPDDEIREIEKIVDKTKLTPEIKEYLKETLIEYDDALRALSK